MGDAQEYRPFDGMRDMALDVMAERWFGPIALRDVGRLHAALLRYESVRCGARTPAATHDARREAGLIEPAVLATYERERARSDVYARPARR